MQNDLLIDYLLNDDFYSSSTSDSENINLQKESKNKLKEKISKYELKLYQILILF